MSLDQEDSHKVVLILILYLFRLNVLNSYSRFFLNLKKIHFTLFFCNKYYSSVFDFKEKINTFTIYTTYNHLQ